MTKLEQAVRKAIKEWCIQNNIEVRSMHHIHPRTYVVARPAPLCLVVAYPLVDAEILVRKMRGNEDLTGLGGTSIIIRLFHKEIDVGNWCSTAYIVSSRGGELVAIPAVES